MGKKKRNSADGEHGSQHHQPPSNDDKGTAGVIYTVRVEPRPDQEQRNTDEATYREQQLCVSRRLNRISAVGAGIALLAFIGLAYNAHLIRAQLGQQINSMHIDERPWVASEDFEAAVGWPRSDPHVLAYPKFRNVGKTPALNTIVKLNYRIFSKEHKFTVADIYYRPELRTPAEFNAYRPNAFYPLPNAWQTYFNFPEEINDEQHQRLMDGKDVIYIFAIFTYNDVFSRSLESKFCVYYLPLLKPPPVACGVYNDTTEEK